MAGPASPTDRAVVPGAQQPLAAGRGARLRSGPSAHLGRERRAGVGQCPAGRTSVPTGRQTQPHRDGTPCQGSWDLLSPCCRAVWAREGAQQAGSDTGGTAQSAADVPARAGCPRLSQWYLVSMASPAPAAAQTGTKPQWLTMNNSTSVWSKPPCRTTPVPCSLWGRAAPESSPREQQQQLCSWQRCHSAAGHLHVPRQARLVAQNVLVPPAAERGGWWSPQQPPPKWVSMAITEP